MKIKSTRKEFKGSNVLQVGYCKLQNLLKYENAFAYNAGVNGWNCDYYELDNFKIIISTGYRPHGLKIDSKTIKHYEDLARSIQEDSNLDYESKKTLTQNLLKDFIGELNQ